MIAPEWTLATAAGGFCRASESRNKFKEMAAMDGIEWGLEHGFYANMGGFAIEAKVPRQENCLSGTKQGDIGLSNIRKAPVLVSESSSPQGFIKPSNPPYTADRTPAVLHEPDNILSQQIDRRSSQENMVLLQSAGKHFLNIIPDCTFCIPP